MNDSYRKGLEDAWKLALHAKSSGAAEDAIRAVLDDGMSVEEALRQLEPPEPVWVLPEWDQAPETVRQFFIARWRNMQAMLNHYPADPKVAEAKAKDDYRAVRAITALTSQE